MRTKVKRITKYKALYQILNQYTEAFEGEALASVQAFSNLNDRLSSLVSNLTRPVNLVYQQRINNRESFVRELELAIKLGLTVGRKTGDADLEATALNYRNTMRGVSDYKLYEKAVHLRELLQPHIAILDELGNKTDLLQKLTEHIQEFSQALTTTGLTLNQRKSGRSEVNALLREGNLLLSREIDGLVEMRKADYGEMYNLYKSMRARRRSQSKAGEKPGLSDISGMVSDAATGLPVPGAQVTLVQQASVIDVDHDGFFVYEELHSGSYTVGCFAPGYQVPEGVVVTLGNEDSVEINFELQAVNPLLN
jgi:hypothetical protein